MEIFIARPKANGDIGLSGCFFARLKQILLWAQMEVFTARPKQAAVLGPSEVFITRPKKKVALGFAEVFFARPKASSVMSLTENFIAKAEESDSIGPNERSKANDMDPTKVYIVRPRNGSIGLGAIFLLCRTSPVNGPT